LLLSFSGTCIDLPYVHFFRNIHQTYILWIHTNDVHAHTMYQVHLMLFLFNI
jgi:hypothetical protein